MKKIVYVIGHRSTDPYRTRNLLLVTKWLAKVKKNLLDYCIHLTVLVIEQDSKPTVNNQLHEDVNYMFVYNSGQYNRGWVFNVGYVNHREADYFFFADNDIVMDTCNIIKVFKTCFRYDAVNPYIEIYDTKSKLFECTKNISFDLDDLIKQNNIYGKRKYICFTGGIVGLSNESMVKLAGWDERFRGRGWEDYAFTSKIKLFLTKIYTYNFKAVHLWHPWDTCSDKCNNSCLNDEYCKYHVDNYIKNIKSTYCNIGCVNKYINETEKCRYESDENCTNITYQECEHCNYCNYRHHYKFDNKEYNDCHKFNDDDYLKGFIVYKKVYIIVKKCNPDACDEELRKLVYLYLCDQYTPVGCTNCDDYDNDSCAQYDEEYDDCDNCDDCDDVCDNKCNKKPSSCHDNKKRPCRCDKKRNSCGDSKKQNSCGDIKKQNSCHDNKKHPICCDRYPKCHDNNICRENQ